METTFKKLESGQTVGGWRELVEISGEQSAKYVEKFARAHHQSAGIGHDGPANSNIGWTKDMISTDHDAASSFAKQHREVLAYSSDSEGWYHRQVQVFEPIPNSLVQGLAGDFAHMVQLQLGENANKLKSRAKINSMVELARAPLHVRHDLIDADRELLGLANGRILGLKTGELLPIHSDSFVTKKAGALFDPAAPCPRWLDFLDSIFAGNKNLIGFVQRAVGYTLSGDVGEQCLFIMIGTGANGKTTFLQALNQLFGDYAVTVPMHTLTVMPFNNGQSNDLAMLEGKRFAAASDGEAGQALAEAKIKNMTGGDTITCRSLYKDFRTYAPQFKLWIATNDFPTVKGSDDAIWRRIRVIEFPVTIPEGQRDPKLGAALAAELSGILNWALEGYRDWKEGGLRVPGEIAGATSSYRTENDILGQFIDQCCIVRPSEQCSMSDLYACYQRWCDSNGHQPVPVNSLGKELTRKGYVSKKGPKGNSRKGIALKPNPAASGPLMLDPLRRQTAA